MVGYVLVGIVVGVVVGLGAGLFSAWSERRRTDELVARIARERRVARVGERRGNGRGDRR